MSRQRASEQFPTLKSHLIEVKRLIRDFSASHQVDGWDALSEFACKVGASWVELRPLSIAAITTPSRIVLVNEDLDDMARLQALAHEIGHLMLSKEVESRLWRSVVIRSNAGNQLRSAIEAFCDEVAKQIDKSMVGNARHVQTFLDADIQPRQLAFGIA